MANSVKFMWTFLARSLRLYLPSHTRPYYISGQCLQLRGSRSAASDATSFTRRTHLCGELRSSDVGQQVVLSGWLQYLRQAQFLVLRDWQGTTQLVIPEDKKDDYEGVLNSLKAESVLEVNGTVHHRPDGQRNEKMATGDIEVVVSSLRVLNTCQPQLPFELKGFHEVKESLRMEHRYLDLRQQHMQRNLRLRSKLVMRMREFLANKHEFVEVETPTLFRRTPGGAKEFVVPSHIPGKFYSLPQSPQQFKQLLMVGGIDRYFQIARCYRDEGAKPDRQPEFTQVDVEMSFIDSDGIISLMEDLLKHTWPAECGTLNTPFPQMKYLDAMTQYGCDKPDTRLQWKLADVTELFSTSPPPVFQDIHRDGFSVQALRIPSAGKHFSNKEVEETAQIGRQFLPPSLKLIALKAKEDGTVLGSLAKHVSAETSRQLADTLQLEEDDIVFFGCGESWDPHTALSRVRLRCADRLQEKGVQVRDLTSWNFLWVRDFPLFLPREDGGEDLESAHHPFTAPHPEDEELLYTQPEKARGLHYDLVLNGQEIGGGSIRIHNADLQRYVLNNILKEETSQLGHLLSALDSGCPPHGGIALGLDRLVAIACGTDSIRDVIAFPKSHDGKDLMSGAPASVSQTELDAYHICVRDISQQTSDSIDLQETEMGTRQSQKS